MQALTTEETHGVSGGRIAGGVVMTLATSWAGAVAGFAAGSIVPGAGNVVGGLVGFGVRALAGIGYSLCQGSR